MAHLVLVSAEIGVVLLRNEVRVYAIPLEEEAYVSWSNVLFERDLFRSSVVIAFFETTTAIVIWR